MTYYPDKQRVDATVSIPVPTRNSNGSPALITSSYTQSDFTMYKDGNLMTLSPSVVHWSSSINNVTGSNRAYVSQSNDTDFTEGSRYELWWTTGSIEGVDVVELLAAWSIESKAQKGARRYLDIYKDHELTGSVSHSTGRIEVSPIVSASVDLTGEFLLWKDTSANNAYFIRCTNFITSGSGRVAVVEMLNGAALPATPDAGDFLFRGGQYTSDVRYINATPMSGSGTANNPWGPE